MPYTTHTRYLASLLGCNHASERIAQRSVRMHKTMLRSSNRLVRYWAKSATSSTSTIMGRNLACVAKMMNITVEQVVRTQKINFTEIDNEELSILQAVDELSSMHIENFTEFERHSMMNYLLCN